MKTMHTPGPWKKDDPCNGRLSGYVRHDGCFAVAKASKSGRCYQEYLANANLIAAAPCIFQSLIEMLELRSATMECRVMKKNEIDVVKDARAAIAKATGGEG